MFTRTRYAPSPTGLQHIGNLRTALFSYLFAKANNGKFLLRIEDTDRKRYNQEAVADIKQNLEWFNIYPDEPVSYQSNRLKIYQQYANDLIDRGLAYEEYSRHSTCVRLIIPETGGIEINDLLLGEIEFKYPDIPDNPVILKSDGFPTYHLASVVDDTESKITHVFRGQEWLSSAPIHMYLYQCIGVQNPPSFIHLPVINGEDGKKLSKRHGDTSVSDFRRNLFDPQAMLNYMSLLGWRPKTEEEIFSLEELEEMFDISGLNKGPAIFDIKKLLWYNKQYMMNYTDEKILSIMRSWRYDFGKHNHNLIQVLRPRLSKEDEIQKWLNPLLELDYSKIIKEDLIPKKVKEQEAINVLSFFEEYLNSNEIGGDTLLDNILRELSKLMNIPFKKFMSIIRVALAHTPVSLPLTEFIQTIGREEAVNRLQKAWNILSDKQN